MYKSSANLRASIRSLLLPSFNKAVFRGLHTTTSVTCGFSRSYNQAAQVPSSNVMRKSPRSPPMNCRIMLALVSMTDSITIFPLWFITAIEILSLCTSIPIPCGPPDYVEEEQKPEPAALAERRLRDPDPLATRHSFAALRRSKALEKGHELVVRFVTVKTAMT